MDGPRFAKLCRETGVQAGRLNSVAVDIIFSSVKTKVSLHLAVQLSPSSRLPISALTVTAASIASRKARRMTGPLTVVRRARGG